MDGVSCLPILTGERDSIRENYIVTEHHGHQQVFWQRMVRTPEFKYIFNPTSRDEFYDLENDLGETTNIAKLHPQVVESLLKLAEAARKDIGDDKTIGENARFFDPQPKRPDIAKALGKGKK